MSQSEKLIPNLDKENTGSLCLTELLQKFDPFVEEVLIAVARVVYFEHNVGASQLDWKNVEGSFLVVRRNAGARYQFMVINHGSVGSLVRNLLRDFEYEVQVPYIFHVTAQEVSGLWFSNAHDCEEVANLFRRILLDPPSEVPTISKVCATESKFEDKDTQLTLAVMDSSLPLKKKKVMDTSLEPPSSSTSNVAHVPEYQSIASFINTSRDIGTTSTHTSRDIGTSSTHVGLPVESHHSSRPVVSDHSQGVILPVLPASSTTRPTPENSGSNTAMKHTTVVPSPSSFLAPPGFSSPFIIPPSHQPLTPLSSLPSTSVPPPNYGPIITREKVRETLQVLFQLLLQDNQFIDTIYGAVQNANKSK